MHPHKPDNKRSNRPPTLAELELGKPALRMLVNKFPSAKVVAVGKKAKRLLDSMRIVSVAVRHPSYGGATAFRQELESLVDGRNPD
jgi:hypothetical protein